MNSPASSSQGSGGFEFSVRCPKCGSRQVPKNQEVARVALERGSFIMMKCSKCGISFEYDRSSGVRNASEDPVIDIGDVMMGEQWNAEGLDVRHKGRPTEALKLHEKALQVYLKMRHTSQIVQTKIYMALALEAAGQRAKALVLLEECETSARQSGDDQGLQVSLGNQAAMLADAGEIGKAVDLLAQQAAVCSRTGNTKALGQVKLNQGILHIRGLHDLRSGVPMLVQGIRQCKADGMEAVAAQALPILQGAARMIFVPILTGQSATPSPDAMTEVKLIQRSGLEFRDPILFDLATHALTRLLLFEDDVTAAVQCVVRRLQTVAGRLGRSPKHRCSR